MREDKTIKTPQGYSQGQVQVQTTKKTKTASRQGKAREENTRKDKRRQDDKDTTTARRDK